MTPAIAKICMCLCSAGIGAGALPVAKVVKHRMAKHVKAPKRHLPPRRAIALAPCPPGISAGPIATAGAGLMVGPLLALDTVTLAQLASADDRATWAVGGPAWFPLGGGGFDDNVGWGGGGFGATPLPSVPPQPPLGVPGGPGAVPPSTVPEPATWALVAVGFGFAGVAVRSRRPTPSAPIGRLTGDEE